ncbi:MAG: hypothetical protein A2X86_08240 [Bdellovibrionales bacterium GWA2_49_15]|nr:MAG: hypothetical protein A2X86_08240 [Bdellovibrionales bacterium GWA2_49_15]HAZ11250.1 hypothetical protein [Bdellovibrionales bacterium]
MRNILSALLVSLMVLSQASASDTTRAPSLPIVLIKMDKNGNKDIQGLEGVLFEKKGLQRERLNSALRKTIGKLSKVIHKVMKQNEDQKGKYILSEVEVGLSLSTDLGINDIVSVGGKAGVVLHFSKN